MRRKISWIYPHAVLLAVTALCVGSTALMLGCERSGGNAYSSDKGGPDMPMNDESQAASTLAMRLIFEYEGEHVRLISQQPVDVAITGFDISRTDRPGYYVDTRDSDGRTLARVSARQAFAHSTEVFPERPGEPITRVDVEAARGAFTVVVPVAAGADRVAVVRVTSAKPDAPAGVRGASPTPGGPEVKELANFPLHISR